MQHRKHLLWLFSLSYVWKAEEREQGQKPLHQPHTELSAAQSGATVTPRFFMLGRKIGNRCSDLLKLGETYTEIRQKYVTAFIFLLDL